MTARIGPGMVVRWRADSERRIANGYSAAARYRVLGVRVRHGDQGPLRTGRIVIMTPVYCVNWPEKADRNVYRVHERDVERITGRQR